MKNSIEEGNSKRSLVRVIERLVAESLEHEWVDC